jgi:hypothetical protein
VRKNLLTRNETPNGHQGLADVAPNASVDQRYAPVRRLLPQKLDLVAEIRYHAIADCCVFKRRADF